MSLFPDRLSRLGVLVGRVDHRLVRIHVIYHDDLIDDDVRCRFLHNDRVDPDVERLMDISTRVNDGRATQLASATTVEPEVHDHAALNVAWSETNEALVVQVPFSSAEMVPVLLKISVTTPPSRDCEM